MKKALMNASVASMIYKFNMDNIEILEELGYQVDVACNFGKENPIGQEQIDDFKSILKKKNIKAYGISCPRSVFAVGKMINAYKQMKKIADKGNYDLVHTQSPIGGVVCRLAFRKARKKGTKVIYQAHGFHFFRGAPFVNWLIFYPIEKFCSRFTDVLITINREDYERAKAKFHAKRVEYVPGVGIDLSRFHANYSNKQEKRDELNIPDGTVWLLCVGELIEKGNNGNLIKAVEQIKNVVLTIVGKGELLEELQNLAAKLNVEERVRFLGHRTDISELYETADIFVFPSYQEELPVALMEAMASGMPVLCSNTCANKDLIDNGKGGYLFNPDSVDEIITTINRILKEDFEYCGKYNKEKIIQFGLPEVMEKKKTLFSLKEGYNNLEKLIFRYTIRKELGISEQDLLLLSVGELNKNKNHQIVIKALSEIEDNNIHYAIAGQGELEADLRKLAFDLRISDRIHFLGFRTDIHKWYSASDIFIFPSFREGLSVALMEAMASGMPVICSGIRGNIDLIDKEGGYVFNPQQKEELIEAIRFCVRDADIREQLSEHNKDKIKEFSIDIVSKKMKGVYEL